MGDRAASPPRHRAEGELTASPTRMRAPRLSARSPRRCSLEPAHHRCSCGTYVRSQLTLSGSREMLGDSSGTSGTCRLSKVVPQRPVPISGSIALLSFTRQCDFRVFSRSAVCFRTAFPFLSFGEPHGGCRPREGQPAGPIERVVRPVRVDDHLTPALRDREHAADVRVNVDVDDLTETGSEPGSDQVRIQEGVEHALRARAECAPDMRALVRAPRYERTRCGPVWPVCVEVRHQWDACFW